MLSADRRKESLKVENRQLTEKNKKLCQEYEEVKKEKIKHEQAKQLKSTEVPSMRQMEMSYRMQEIENKVKERQQMMQVMQQSTQQQEDEEDRLL